MFPSRMPAAFVAPVTTQWSIQPAAQTVSPAPAPQPPATCPAPPHCPSLPSSETAYDVVSGKPGAVVVLARDLVLRGFLIWTGIAAYNKVTGQQDEHALAKSIAGAAGIEVFVIAWTWWNAPRPATQPAGAPAGPQFTRNSNPQLVFERRADARAWIAKNFPGFHMIDWLGLPMYDPGDGIPRPIQGPYFPGKFIYSDETVQIADSAGRRRQTILFRLTTSEPIE